MNIKIENSWDDFFDAESKKEYFSILNSSVDDAYKNKIVYPPEDLIFSIFRRVPIDDIRVVILGQDPYHGPGQGNGLAFSVSDGIMPPPSLQNIFKEISDEFPEFVHSSGDLSCWADQGVFLLNTVLTVEGGQPNSHANFGWQTLTDNVVSEINRRCDNVVFLLWGMNAKSKINLIDVNKHLILTAPHPSPLSSYRGFFGCNHFFLANQHLINNGKNSINWNIF